METKAILFFSGCSEVNSTWLITSELANQRARKVLFTCVVYTNNNNSNSNSNFIKTFLQTFTTILSVILHGDWCLSLFFAENIKNPDKFKIL